jgi:hypothetical protein
MGLFDLPAPVFAWLDDRAGSVVPPALRLVLWGVLAGMISLVLYRQLSAQERIRRGRLEIEQARRRLDAHDGDWDEAKPLLRKLLHSAFAQVGRVGWPSVVAGLPLLSLLAWLGSSYGYTFPEPGAQPAIRLEPAGLQSQWVADDCATAALGCPRIVIRRGDSPVAEISLAAAVPVVHKRRWWNALLGNPAGYLPRESVVDWIRIDLPPREYLSLGPRWSRAWWFPFFVSLTCASLLLKRWWRIA